MTNFLYLAIHGIMLSFTLFTMGCAQQHSVEINNESLSFYYSDAEAKEIFFASSIDQFHSHPARKESGDTWKVTVPLNKEFVYFYIVDGKVTMPDCPNTVLDDFGTQNCLYVYEM